jgi:hypothetical protein
MSVKSDTVRRCPEMNATALCTSHGLDSRLDSTRYAARFTSHSGDESQAHRHFKHPRNIFNLSSDKIQLQSLLRSSIKLISGRSNRIRR